MSEHTYVTPLFFVCVYKCVRKISVYTHVTETNHCPKTSIQNIGCNEYKGVNIKDVHYEGIAVINSLTKQAQLGSGTNYLKRDCAQSTTQ